MNLTPSGILMRVKEKRRGKTEKRGLAEVVEAVVVLPVTFGAKQMPHGCTALTSSFLLVLFSPSAPHSAASPIQAKSERIIDRAEAFHLPSHYAELSCISSQG